MPETMREVFSTTLFMPHGHCYLWLPALLWLQVLSNGVIGLSYVAISSTLGYLVYRLRDDIPFRLMYSAFGAFIVLCGITHFFDVYVIWKPAYWLDGGVRALTALVSLGTAVLLPPLIPTASALARGARTARERGMQLETALYDLATTYQKARELEQLKSQFFANVSHELRTPLTLVLGPIERLLAGGALSAEQRAELELAQRNAQLLRRHVDDLLDAERLEAGRLAPEYAETDVAQLVRALAAHFEGLAKERRIEYRVEAPPELIAQVDPAKLERVLTNLLSNAFKFTPKDGRIACRLELNGGNPRGSDHSRSSFRIDVTDSGPGIAAEHRQAVFERFRQLDGGPTRAQSGTGLGLAIAKDLVELQAGTINVAAAPEGGAAFRVILPLSAAEGTSVKPRQPIAEGLGAAAKEASIALAERVSADVLGKTAGRPLVLVVEDNADMNAFVCRLLAEDCNVASAFDGADGLHQALERKPDLIVTDVMMPRVGGDELVRQVRGHAELSQVPIMLLSAKADERLKSELLRAGAQDYLEKPFSAEELRARVGNLLGMKRAQDVLRVEKSRVEAANQELDAFSYSVSHDLRAPLRRIDGLGRALLEQAGELFDDNGRDLLQRIRNETALMAQLIDDLLKLARVARSDFVDERVDLGGLARSILAELRASEPTRTIELALRGDLSTRGDARLLRIALENLLGNAVKFTRKREPTRIELSSEERDGVRVYSLNDNGAGFDPAYASKLFRPFVRLHTAREFEGTGIGLATVQRIVQRHGGRIWAEGAPDGGATFHFSLVAAAEEQAA